MGVKKNAIKKLKKKSGGGKIKQKIIKKVKNRGKKMGKKNQKSWKRSGGEKKVGVKKISSKSKKKKVGMKIKILEV